jgi:hypothetical protein
LALERQRRSVVERVLFRKLWQCRECSTQVRVWRIPFGHTLRFLGSSHTRCISCGNARVRHLTSPDRIDLMSIHPISLLGALVRAPIYHCNGCRRQYHDWRGLNPVMQTQGRRQAPDVLTDGLIDDGPDLRQLELSRDLAFSRTVDLSQLDEPTAPEVT